MSRSNCQIIKLNKFLFNLIQMVYFRRYPITACIKVTKKYVKIRTGNFHFHLK